MKKIINYRALPVFLCFLVIGILIATFLNGIYALAVAVLCGVGILCCIFAPKCRRFLLRSIMITSAILLAFVATGADIYFHNYYNAVDTDNVVIEGKVDTLTEFDENGRVINCNYIILDSVKYTDQEGVSHKVTGKISVKGIKDTELYIGDKVTWTGSLKSQMVDARSHSSISGYKHDVLKHSEVINVDKVERENPDFFDGIKVKAKYLLVKNTYSKNNVAGFIYSMLFGDKSMLDETTMNNFAATGVAHLFAVSGLHVGLIALVLLAILNKTKLNIWLQTIIMIIILIGYNILCGFSPSVTRASLMIVVALFSRALGYRNDSISTLSFACVLILVFRPMFLYDLSFIMTVFAVLGIVLLFNPILVKLKFLPNYIAKPLTLTIAVNIGLFPVIMSYFGSISLLFMVSNMIIIPIISIAYPLIFLATTASLILPFLGFLITPVTYLFELVSIIVNAIAQIPFVVISIDVGAVAIALWLILLVFLSEYVIVGHKAKKIVATCLLFVFTGLVVMSIFGANVKTTTASTAYVDSFSEDAYYHIECADKDYLIINGAITDYGMESTTRYMKFNNVPAFDVVVKEKVSRSDIEQIRNKYRYFLTTTIVSRDIDNRLQDFWKLEYLDSVNEKDIRIFFAKKDEIVAEVEDVRLLYTKNEVITDDIFGKIDIIYTNNNMLAALNYQPKYIVNNNPERLDNLNNEVLTNTFTFVLNNGKIKVRSND